MAPQEPQNNEAERCLLHQIMYEYGLDLDSVIDGDLTPECFYDGRHRAIYECIVSLHKAGERIDITKIFEWLDREKKSGVTAFDVCNLMEVPCAESAPYYVQVLLRYHWRRQGILLCKQCINRLYEVVDTPDDVITSTADVLMQIPLSRRVEQSNLNDAAQMVVKQMMENLDPETRHKGSATGFSAIDSTGGLPETGVTVVAADTSQGKSAFAIDLALQNLRAGEKVGFISLEMPQEDIARRIISAQTGIPFYKLAYSALTIEEQALVNEAVANLSDQGGSRFLFDNRMEASVDDVTETIRRMANPRRDHVTHFYVDYMQILTWAEKNSHSQGTSAERLLAYAARKFHNLSMKIKVQIVLLSQVNRDYDNNELTLDRIRDSKQIADAATCVVLLYRPEAYNTNYQTERFQTVDPRGTAMVHLAKRRNGPLVQFIAGFDGARTHFYELEQLPQNTLADGNKYML